MAATKDPTRRSNAVLAGAGVLMVLCCAVGPAVIGAVAGGVIGGWIGIVGACVVAATAGLLIHWRMRSNGRC